MTSNHHHHHHHRLFSPLSRSRCRTFILLLHSTRLLASSLFSRSCLQSSLMVASQVFFGRPRGLLPSTSHPFQALLTQSDPSFLTTCPYHLSLFLLMQSVMSSSPVISLSSFVECRSRKLFPQSLLSILLSAVLILLSQSTVIGQVSLPYNMQLRTQEWKTLPFIFKEGALEVRKGESSRNFFHPLRIRADVAASAPPLPSSVSPR